MAGHLCVKVSVHPRQEVLLFVLSLSSTSETPSLLVLLNVGSLAKPHTFIQLIRPRGQTSRESPLYQIKAQRLEHRYNSSSFLGPILQAFYNIKIDQ